LPDRTLVDEIPDAPGPAGAEAPLAIETREVGKTFRIPTHRITSLKERAVHPLARPEYRELRALRDVSFDVRKGEFFGIVGRNGSGKSTLLKVLASIYRADSGTVRMDGHPAPFIELGVGFDPELTARENVVLNGVMMGLTPREARRRLDAVLDFAELREFVELKLKNYSSGMMVRLAFAVMTQADADILLIDEVLAVGDAAFQQKCTDTFREMRKAGKTIVLVTHDMSTVEEFCSRGMLIDEGVVRYLGASEDVARRYLRLNFDRDADSEQRFEGQTGSEDARVVRAWLEDSAGERVANLEQGEPIRIRAEIEARRDVSRPSFGFVITNADEVHVCGVGTHLGDGDGRAVSFSAGERARLAATIENPLNPGRYSVDFFACRNGKFTDVVMAVPHLIDFVVYGPVWAPGIVSVEAEIEALRGPEGEA
jgi:ABC-type polysaccharide/polyol phosphate transport system ATPase subunit